MDLRSKIAIPVHCRTLLIWPLTGHTKLAVLTEVGRIKGVLVFFFFFFFFFLTALLAFNSDTIVVNEKLHVHKGEGEK